MCFDIRTLIARLKCRLEVIVTNNPSTKNSEKEAIRLQLLASMLASTNLDRSNRFHGLWPNLWQGLRKKTKILQQLTSCFLHCSFGCLLGHSNSYKSSFITFRCLYCQIAIFLLISQNQKVTESPKVAILFLIESSPKYLSHSETDFPPKPVNCDKRPQNLQKNNLRPSSCRFLTVQC